MIEGEGDMIRIPEAEEVEDIGLDGKVESGEVARIIDEMAA